MNNLNSLYSKKVMDHFNHPRNVGELPNANGVATVGNPRCGDVMRMFVRIEKKGKLDYIKDVKFQTLGCAAALATSSIATEIIKGKSVEDALKLTNKVVMDELDGLPVAKHHCSVLAEQAVRGAIENYYKNKGGDVPKTSKQNL